MAAKQTRAAREVPAHILGPRIVLLLSVFILLLLGFVMIYSASSVLAIGSAETVDQAQPALYLFDQIKFAVIGTIAAIILWKFLPYNLWEGPLMWGIWGAAIVLLVLTAAMGNEALGATRWLVLGPISLQPSEFAKIAFVLMGARILFDFRSGALTVRGMFIQAGLLLLLPILFLYQTQSDLGTTLIIFIGILAVMWMGEVPLRIIVAILVAGMVFMVISIVFTGYRSSRMLFLNPWDDGSNGYDGGYQLIHSFYAFSEGGIFGVGLGNSREKFDYLPEAETDFIFAIVGEELGLVGAMFVIGLFLAILYAGMHIARSAPDEFGSMVAGSCTIMIVFQAFLNIGCVIGVLPTTGKPLPFVSSGGSSLIATMIMVGLILSVSQAAGTEPSIHERRRADLRIVRADPEPSRVSRRSADPVDTPSSSRSSSRRHAKTGSTGGIGWDALSSRSSKQGSTSQRSSTNTSRRGRR